MRYIGILLIVVITTIWTIYANWYVKTGENNWKNAIRHAITEIKCLFK